ncbi:ATP-binding protein [Candidatus Pacearchaeota archaeon]|nr:ATP-binding protein [Candidatus Pacearchaeota archaeon]
MELIYNRKLISKILPLLKTRDIIVIHGARQVGKSSLIRYFINHHINENYFYMDLENLEYLDLCNKGPEAVFKFLIGKGLNAKERIILLIDEIQYLKKPSNFLKIFHDHYENIKLIVSGSSSFDIKRKFKESLVGRTINFELFPLDFEEFLEFKGKKYILKKENPSEINTELIGLFEEYNSFGGYPKIVLEKNEENKKLMLSQIISTYIKKDIRDLGNIRNIESFNRLVVILASQSGNLLNVVELSNTLGIDQKTIKEWIFLLEATYIIKLVRPYHKNIRSELTKNPKIFFIDTGLMHLLHLKNFPKTIIGSSLENSIFSELLKNEAELNFWRTTNKQEIDFIVLKGKMIAIEVKLNFQQSITSSLNFFKEKYHSRNFVVALYGNKDKKFKKYPWEMICEIKSPFNSG